MPRGRKPTHGLRDAAEYPIWAQMRNRCYRPASKGYDRYGARGITVCDRWRHDFAAFYADMGPRPSPQHQLDRIDNDGPYSPDNCRWSTAREQANNRRSNRVIEFNGRAMTLMEWAAETGMRRETISHRIDSGWPIDIALTKPTLKNGQRWRQEYAC